MIDGVEQLLRSLERYDFLSVAHTWRVTLYARAVAEAAGLDHEAVDRVSVGAALHDVGKLDVPLAILQKPAKLSDDEFEQVKRHPVHGVRRLQELGIDDEIAMNIVRHHHERVDGKGYPDGLRGGDIPPGARYFAVVDSFDALTSVRPYRAEVGKDAAERALVMLREDIGTRYCEEAVDLFERVYRSGVIAWVLQYYNDETKAPAFTLSTMKRAKPDS